MSLIPASLLRQQTQELSVDEARRPRSQNTSGGTPPRDPYNVSRADRPDEIDRELRRAHRSVVSRLPDEEAVHQQMLQRRNSNRQLRQLLQSATQPTVQEDPFQQPPAAPPLTSPNLRTVTPSVREGTLFEPWKPHSTTRPAPTRVLGVTHYETPTGQIRAYNRRQIQAKLHQQAQQNPLFRGVHLDQSTYRTEAERLFQQARGTADQETNDFTGPEHIGTPPPVSGFGGGSSLPPGRRPPGSIGPSDGNGGNHFGPGRGQNTPQYGPPPQYGTGLGVKDYLYDLLASHRYSPHAQQAHGLLHTITDDVLFHILATYHGSNPDEIAKQIVQHARTAGRYAQQAGQATIGAIDRFDPEEKIAKGLVGTGNLLARAYQTFQNYRKGTLGYKRLIAGLEKQLDLSDPVQRGILDDIKKQIDAAEIELDRWKADEIEKAYKAAAERERNAKVRFRGTRQVVKRDLATQARQSAIRVKQFARTEQASLANRRERAYGDLHRRYAEEREISKAQRKNVRPLVHQQVPQLRAKILQQLVSDLYTKYGVDARGHVA